MPLARLQRTREAYQPKVEKPIMVDSADELIPFAPRLVATCDYCMFSMRPCPHHAMPPVLIGEGWIS